MASTKFAFRRLKWQRRRTRKRIRKARRVRRRSKTPITIYQIKSQPHSWDFIFPSPPSRVGELYRLD
jgi:hypothetical protein